MTKNDDEFIVNALKEKYKGALENYNKLKKDIQIAKDELNKCISALNVWSSEPLESIEENDSEIVKKGKENNEKKDSENEVYKYDSKASIKAKVVRILQIHDRAMSKAQIVDYICQMEPNADKEHLKTALGTPVHLLNKDGVIAQSKVKGVKMKGSFYGKPEWLVQDGIWKTEHQPLIEKKQKNLWD